MNRNWTFGQKVAAGFALTVALSMLMGAVAIYTLRAVVASKDHVITVNGPLLLEAERISGLEAEAAAEARGFLLTREERFLGLLREARKTSEASLDRLRQGSDDAEARRLLDAIERSRTEYRDAVDRVIVLRQGNASVDAVSRVFDRDVAPKRQALARQVDVYTQLEERLLDDARQASSETATLAIRLLIGIVVLVVVLAALTAFLLTRALGRQIGAAVGHVQSSAAELQSAANQQATGAKEQATAMSEITTTISELLATSRQIAESAQRVAQIAGQTANAARSGETTVDKAQESIAVIRRQVDLIVSHMLELGKKSQQIGGILDIVTELAEQTNILAINATIEAVGAGEAGKRFSVVADEIRKLADRVGGTTKEVRGLIDDVRGALNTTVMATESGSKAVDAGSKQFTEVAASFQAINTQVATTTEAAREIELSTKQQTTAVEQVNLAISDVAQATKETEASSGQTLQTASQLAELSRDLLRLVQPRLAT